MIWSIVPVAYRWLALVLLLVAAVAFGWVKGAGYEQGKQAVRDSASTRVNSGITAKWLKGKDDALKNSAARAIANKRDADAARDASDGLHNDVATLRSQLSTASRDAVNQYASTVSDVFEQCSRRYSDLAATADGIVNDRKTLIESWPHAIP